MYGYLIKLIIRFSVVEMCTFKRKQLCKKIEYMFFLINAFPQIKYSNMLLKHTMTVWNFISFILNLARGLCLAHFLVRYLNAYKH